VRKVIDERNVDGEGCGNFDVGEGVCGLEMRIDWCFEKEVTKLVGQTSQNSWNSLKSFDIENRQHKR
jgi:hypothetical protein